MKIIVNAVGYVGQSGGAGGAGVFLQYLIGKLAEHHAVDVLIRPNTKGFYIRHPGVRFIELDYVTDEIFRHLREGPTVVVDPFGGLPCLPFPDDVALCVVVHDLMHLERPHFFTRPEKEGRSISFARGLERADAVVTFSADQARAIKRFYRYALPVVIPHLPYACLRDESLPGPARDLGVVDPFILFPAVKWPHKNHRTVIEAFGTYVRETQSKLRLFLCGGTCAENRFSYYPAKQRISDRITDLGLVDESTLAALFAKASAVLFPTLYEGFGIPVLEAAYLGKMVVASRLDVFDEILGAKTYRGVEDPLCHLRWMEAFADIESAKRADFEKATLAVRAKVDPARFTKQFSDLLERVAKRYSEPAAYPIVGFQSEDRPTSRLSSTLSFTDIYSNAIVEPGERQAALGRTSRTSTIFRGTSVPVDRRICIRAVFGESAPEPEGTPYVFSAWLRLRAEPKADALLWSINDRDVIDLLPELKDGKWHLFRRPVTHSGFVDFRAVLQGQSESVGTDLEIHDPCVLSIPPMPIPAEDPPRGCLTVYVAALAESARLGSVSAAIEAVNSALDAAAGSTEWVVVTTPHALDGAHARDLPANLRVNVIEAGSAETFGRADAARLVAPYQPFDQLLLLEAEDLTACLKPGNLIALASAATAVGHATPRSLDLDLDRVGFWTPSERGRIISVGHRVGMPLPLLDEGVIQECLVAHVVHAKPRFAVIETDLSGGISHHSGVTGLFLDGAKAQGLKPILGLNRAAPQADDDEIEVWRGFSNQVYKFGSADGFSQELAAFCKAQKLGANDVIFMHSLAPQILLGAARFVIANPAGAPHFAMRFFSTAEAMASHKLSYTKIVKSIHALRILREKMHFFCESENLITYYEKATLQRFPLLLNPEHPSLRLVRDSGWRDGGAPGAGAPVLAYFGEARAEKGFDYIPDILQELIDTPSMDEFQFLIQIGSNWNNQTPQIERAKVALNALRIKYPGRIRTFDSVEAPEEFYFLMKHVRGVIAPYRPESYGIRGTGVTLEALQMGLDVFAWVETDLYATFKHTGHLIGVETTETFAEVIARHYADAAPRVGEGVESLRQSPGSVFERLMAACRSTGPSTAEPPVLWVGNDTFGEGCSMVYGSQKRALRAIGRDCIELFVPWPDRNKSAAADEFYDEIVYGLDSEYEGDGFAWVARPKFGPQLDKILDTIHGSGPTYALLRDLNRHMVLPRSLSAAIKANRVDQTILNYAHLYPVIQDMMPLEGIICEMHDIVAYQHAVRRGGPVSLTEKIDELSDLSRFPQVVAISAAEQREVESACPGSEVSWQLPPYVPEPVESPVSESGALEPDAMTEGHPMDEIARPSPLMISVYQSRPDLQKKFELKSPAGRREFFSWWVFFGQFETGGRFAFTRRQYDWLVQTPPKKRGAPAEPCGLLQLFLERRDDLRATFGTPKGVDVGGLESWHEANAQREFGFSRDTLIAQGTQYFSGAGLREETLNLGALDAVLIADPTDLAARPVEQQAMLERIGQIGAIDLILVGSGHPANVESFNWFVKDVYVPHIAPLGRSLFIAGSACRQLSHLLHPKLVLLGRCRRIEPLLKASRACPLPVIAGSGSPIKTIPALAVNGAVTVTDRVSRAFGLADYDIPSFSDPKAFAGDLLKLLSDNATREARVSAAQRYVAERLSADKYAEFWRRRLAVSVPRLSGKSPVAATGLGGGDVVRTRASLTP